MNKEWAEKWTKALRSGKYKQCKSKLKTKEGYCCLGVLTDLVDPLHPSLIKCPVLAEDIMKTTGMKDQCGVTSPRDGRSALVTMNDLGKPFPEIADFIDRHWEDL